MIKLHVNTPMTIISWATLTLMFGVPCVAPAQELGCDSAMTQRDINACISAGAARADSMVVQLVSELREPLSKASYEALQAIHQEWRANRDATCRWEMGLVQGGSIAPTIYADCIVTLTWQRIDYLKAFLCDGGGMSGPCDRAGRYERLGPVR